MVGDLWSLCKPEVGEASVMGWWRRVSWRGSGLRWDALAPPAGGPARMGPAIDSR
ncbi:hypothetical protein OSI08_02260 [Mycobacterium ulcerans]